MGLFSLKPSAADKLHIESELKILEDCKRLVNTTTNPDVFFGRMNCLLDCLLDLQNYEYTGVLKGDKPSVTFERINVSMENTVNDFIDRAVQAEACKISELKTIKARESRIKKFEENMQSAFTNSTTFWQGNGRGRHFEGRMWRDGNIEYFRKQILRLYSRFAPKE